MIKIYNLTKSYGKKLVLNDLELNIEPNQIHGLVGSNGAGKTTLFNCIYNLHKYSGGIQIMDKVQVGYMPTSLFFYPNMQAMEYIEFCLAARKQKIEKSRIEKVNQLFDLPLKEYAAEYSTGMKKKLMLMALFLQNNDLYLLDEPFNGLDLSASLLLKHIMLKLKNSKKTILISSHIISSLTDVCDNISYLKAGYIYKTYQKQEFNLIENEITQNDIKERLSILDDLSI